jgi:DNA-binding PadR family transcriptional regulator
MIILIEIDKGQGISSLIILLWFESRYITNPRGKFRIMRNNLKLIQEQDERVTKQFLDLQILYLLRAGPKTLYSMRSVLLETFGIQRSFGTIHPHLTRLEKLGLIEGFTIPSKQSKSHFPKRIYRLTRKGRSSLEREVNLLSKMVTKMARNGYR